MLLDALLSRLDAKALSAALELVLELRLSLVRVRTPMLGTEVFDWTKQQVVNSGLDSF